ncbi:MAG: hypothetical protein ACFFBD_08320 [Candidatus Hodarchaeota archaeon]
MELANLRMQANSFKVLCPQCGKDEVIEINSPPKESFRQGLAHFGIDHKCLNNEMKLLILYFDQESKVQDLVLVPILQKKRDELHKELESYTGNNHL